MPGPHLADAAAMLPVLRAQIGLGARLAELPGVVAICWQPAGTWMEPGYFRKIAEGWLAGGAFPALGLVAHDVSASGVLRTSGLQFLIGQELQLDGRGSLDRAGLARIALRLVHELVLAGPVRADSELVGPEGQQLFLHPRAGSAIIEATIAG